MIEQFFNLKRMGIFVFIKFFLCCFSFYKECNECNFLILQIVIMLIMKTYEKCFTRVIQQTHST